MILCPSCHNQVVAGSLFCNECGTQLMDARRASTMSFGTTDFSSKADLLDFPIPTLQSEAAVGSGVSLHVVETGEVITLEGREEYTLGRSSEGQSVLPDIDLTLYDAFEKGVSRIHVSVKTVGQKLTITDLGSVNGTRVNGIKILPKQVYPLKHGDILTLGKLKFQVITR